MGMHNMGMLMNICMLYMCMHMLNMGMHMLYMCMHLHVHLHVTCIWVVCVREKRGGMPPPAVHTTAHSVTSHPQCAPQAEGCPRRQLTETPRASHMHWPVIGLEWPAISPTVQTVGALCEACAPAQLKDVQEVAH